MINNNTLIKKLNKIWFLREIISNNKIAIEVVDIKAILLNHPQLMYTNFIQASFHLDTISKNEPASYCIPIKAHSNDTVHMVEAFMSAYKEAESFCRNEGEIKLDSFLMRDETDINSHSTHRYHSKNLAYAMSVVDNSKLNIDDICYICFENSMSPQETVTEYSLNIITSSWRCHISNNALVD
jgi:hypothetical protein